MTVKVLIIDDDSATRLVLREILAGAGYQVLLAADGEEGLQLARSEHPHLVISDILMPRVDGFRFLHDIRKERGFADLPVIFYTGNYLDADDVKLARDLGVTRFLIKPVAPAELVAVVREAEATPPAGPAASDPSLDAPAMLNLYNERMVAKLKHTAIEKEDARRHLSSIMESMADGVLVIDLDHTIIEANAAAAASLGLDRSELIGRRCFEAAHHREMPCEGPDIICPFRRIIERGESVVKVLHTHVAVSGEERQIEITASPVRDEHGAVFAIVETYRDIMEKRSDDELVKLVKRLNDAQTHLKLMAITDDLTGLRNRRYIVDRLEEEYRRARRSGNPLSLIMLDIDHFKRINDEYGHLFGDVVLRVIASRISSILRKHDIVGRVGGEEFLVICPESSAHETQVVAERIRQVVCEEPIGDGIKRVTVALSAGVTMLMDSDRYSEKVFSRADAALYKAKEAGRNRVVVM